MNITPRNSERGSATLENVIAYPVVILLLFGVFQACMFYHAQNVAQGAATVAFHAARVYNGTAESGRAAGQAALGNTESLAGANVRVARTATATTVTVTGRAAYIVPGFPGSTVTKVVTGPTERYVQ